MPDSNITPTLRLKLYYSTKLLLLLFRNCKKTDNVDSLTLNRKKKMEKSS